MSQGRLHSASLSVTRRRDGTVLGTNGFRVRHSVTPGVCGEWDDHRDDPRAAGAVTEAKHESLFLAIPMGACGQMPLSKEPNMVVRAKLLHILVHSNMDQI